MDLLDKNQVVRLINFGDFCGHVQTQQDFKGNFNRPFLIHLNILFSFFSLDLAQFYILFTLSMLIIFAGPNGKPASLFSQMI